MRREMIKQILELLFGDQVKYVSYSTIEKIAKKYSEVVE